MNGNSASNIATNQPPQEHASTVAHELNHARRFANNKGRLATDVDAEYDEEEEESESVGEQVEDEVQANGGCECEAPNIRCGGGPFIG